MSVQRNVSSTIVQSGSAVHTVAGLQNDSAADFRRRAKWFAFASGLLIICFGKPLYELVRFSLGNSLYSHLLLIPFISFYLAWLKKTKLKPDSRPALHLAAIPLIVSIFLLGAWIVGANWAETNYLPLLTVSFLLLVLSGFLALFGRKPLDQLAFPAALLVFMIPFPQSIESVIESFFQHTSAGMSHFLISASNIPVLRDGLTLYMPGIALEVAPECSGIRSSLVLFITSLLAGHFFLKNNWNKALLAFAVIPLGILRNALRITTLANLSVHVNPEMIHSPLHTSGGPVFFVLSLAPLFALLIVLRKRETCSGTGVTPV